MTISNRRIMLLAMILAFAAIAADHIRHRPPYLSDGVEDGFAGEVDAPCSMGHGGEEDEDDEL